MMIKKVNLFVVLVFANMCINAEMITFDGLRPAFDMQRSSSATAAFTVSGNVWIQMSDGKFSQAINRGVNIYISGGPGTTTTIFLQTIFTDSMGRFSFSYNRFGWPYDSTWGFIEVRCSQIRQFVRINQTQSGIDFYISRNSTTEK
jgi:hypothetical protein